VFHRWARPARKLLIFRETHFETFYVVDFKWLFTIMNTNVINSMEEKFRQAMPKASVLHKVIHRSPRSKWASSHQGHQP
jgi:hypothetical protein